MKCPNSQEQSAEYTECPEVTKVSKKPNDKLTTKTKKMQLKT